MARLVELKQPHVFLAKVVNTVHLPQPFAWIAQRERSRSSQMIHVLTAKMVNGALWDPLCALIVNLVAFGATCRLVAPVALQELSVDRRPSSAKNVLQDGSAEILHLLAKFVLLGSSATKGQVHVMFVLQEVSV